MRSEVNNNNRNTSVDAWDGGLMIIMIILLVVVNIFVDMVDVMLLVCQVCKLVGRIMDEWMKEVAGYVGTSMHKRGQSCTVAYQFILVS